MNDVITIESINEIIQVSSNDIVIVEEAQIDSVEVNESINIIYGSDTIQKITGTAISGHRVVCVKSDGKIYYADPDDTMTAGILGISKEAGNANTSINIQTQGEIQHSGWSFTIGDPVFAGYNGMPTQTIVGTAYIVCIGIATNTDRINININSPIYL